MAKKLQAFLSNQGIEHQPTMAIAGPEDSPRSLPSPPGIVIVEGGFFPASNIAVISVFFLPADELIAFLERLGDELPPGSPAAPPHLINWDASQPAIQEVKTPPPGEP